MALKELKIMPQGKSQREEQTLDPLGWLLLLTKATAIALGLFVQAVVELARGRRGNLHFRQYIGYAGVRDFQKGLDAVGIQSILPSTSKTCVEFAKKHGLTQTEIRLPDATVAQWLGPQNARKVIVQFHGGGYMSPALNEHLSLIFGFGKKLRKDVSAVVLQYDLASEHANHYPRQLQQAVNLIHHLISANVSPSSILLVGDSAGAHLLLSLVVHICQPNPAVSPLLVEGHFSGAILISPWIKLNSSTGSMIYNKDKDTLTAVALKYWAKNFLGNATLDYWNSPWMIPDHYLADLPIDDILVLFGDHELLLDDTSAFCERLVKYHPHAKALVFPNEVHSHMILNRFLGVEYSSDSEKAFNDWTQDQLRP